MKYKFTIEHARKEQAPEIAQLIMLAMNHDCCQNIAGPHHSLDDFHRVLTSLVEAEESLYSYRNTLAAITPKGELAGICVGYDGSRFSTLKTSLHEALRREFGQDLSTAADETEAGEYYLDSLAVSPQHQGKGVATALLRAEIDLHGDRQPVGLLVDTGNPLAQKLYERIGFSVVGDATWAGHPMRHMQYPPRCAWARHDTLMEAYHDNEWGVPVHDDRRLYELLLMEAMSCGLSWAMMLQRREVFRECFAAFDPYAVALFTPDQAANIMQADGMIRSRRKIDAMISNAQAFVRVAEEFGSFDHYIWSFSEGRSLIYPVHQHQWATRNDLSDRVAKDLKRRGFKFVGTSIIYSYLQAIGIINDHTEHCFCYRNLKDKHNYQIIR